MSRQVCTTKAPEASKYSAKRPIIKSLLPDGMDSLLLTLFRPGGGGGGGGGGARKVPAPTLNVYNFFKIQPNAAKLYEFF